MPEFKDIVSDSFWWVLANVVKKEAANPETKDKEGESDQEGESKVGSPNSKGRSPTSVGSGSFEKKKKEKNSPTKKSRKFRFMHEQQQQRDPDMAKYDSPFFIRLSTNFVKMFERIPFSKKDYFFGHFPDVMTFSLLLSFTSAYPRSKSKIDDFSFKQNLLDLCSEWTTGLRASKRANLGTSWVMEYDLQDGNRGGGAAERLKHMGDSTMNPAGTPGTNRRKINMALMKSGEGSEGSGGEVYVRPIR